MKINVMFSDNINFAKILTLALEPLLSDIQSEKEVLLINVNHRENEFQKLTERIGLKIAEERQHEDIIIILMGFESEKSLSQDFRFRGLISRSNIGFLQLPVKLTVYADLIKNLLSGNKKEDKTAYELYASESRERLLSELQHNYYWLKNDSAKKEKLEKARKAGITGSDEEIIEYIKNWKRNATGKFTGKFLEGIFVDALDTLFTADWKLNINVFTNVSLKSSEQGKKVFIISDSEESILKSALNKTEINWTTISKYDLRGSTLEIVIDNLNEEEFREKYQIIPQKFINVLAL